MSIAENLSRVRERIDAAARRAGRQPEDVALMAVSKTFSAERIRDAFDAGLRLFGENRVQEFAGKIDALQDLHDTEWHLIGHLQSNKAAKAVELFAAVDSVDSLRLAQRLNAFAQQLRRKLKVLIEINVGGEAAKSGVAPNSHELEELLSAAAELQHLEVRGLMTIPPFTDDPQQARPYFRKLREVRDHVVARRVPAVDMRILSMGMSHDFEVAIEEGSTCVRVGTAIFGERSVTTETQGHRELR
ncbi:MAG TPA: YggS family pyridoxal phosphate-dependent enzyme [Terriglobales bacterium]|nr:YggS family pyridoxal phosphate-dependent enzyme [Terriglobales bacterium]